MRNVTTALKTGAEMKQASCCESATPSAFPEVLIVLIFSDPHSTDFQKNNPVHKLNDEELLAFAAVSTCTPITHVGNGFFRVNVNTVASSTQEKS